MPVTGDTVTVRVSVPSYGNVLSGMASKVTYESNDYFSGKDAVEDISVDVHRLRTSNPTSETAVVAYTYNGDIASITLNEAIKDSESEGIWYYISRSNSNRDITCYNTSGASYTMTVTYAVTLTYYFIKDQKITGDYSVFDNNTSLSGTDYVTGSTIFKAKGYSDFSSSQYHGDLFSSGYNSDGAINDSLFNDITSYGYAVSGISADYTKVIFTHANDDVSLSNPIFNWANEYIDGFYYNDSVLQIATKRSTPLITLSSCSGDRTLTTGSNGFAPILALNKESSLDDSGTEIYHPVYIGGTGHALDGTSLGNSMMNIFLKWYPTDSNDARIGKIVYSSTASGIKTSTSQLFADPYPHGVFFLACGAGGDGGESKTGVGYNYGIGGSGGDGADTGLFYAAIYDLYANKGSDYAIKISIEDDTTKIYQYVISSMTSTLLYTCHPGGTTEVSFDTSTLVITDTHTDTVGIVESISVEKYGRSYVELVGVAKGGQGGKGGYYYRSGTSSAATVVTPSPTTLIGAPRVHSYGNNCKLDDGLKNFLSIDDTYNGETGTASTIGIPGYGGQPTTFSIAANSYQNAIYTIAQGGGGGGCFMGCFPTFSTGYKTYATSEITEALLGNGNYPMTYYQPTYTGYGCGGCGSNRGKMSSQFGTASWSSNVVERNRYGGKAGCLILKPDTVSGNGQVMPRSVNWS